MIKEHVFTPFQKYTSAELCHFFKKSLFIQFQNGFTELDEIVAQNNITGETVMTLKEFEIMKWKMSMAEKRKLWAFLGEFKENPQKFFDQDAPQFKKKFITAASNHKLLRQNTDLKEKLEQIIGNKPLITTSKIEEDDHEKNVDSNHELLRQNNDLKERLEQISGNKTSINASSINDVKDDLEMDTKANLYDEHGYTIILNSVERPVRKNEYETIKPTKFRFKPKIQEPAQIEIFSRKPMVFPRSDVDEEGYIQGPGLPLMIHGINQNAFPRIRRNIQAPNEDVSNNTEGFYEPMSPLSKNNECKEAEEGIYEPMSSLSEIVRARDDLYEPMSPPKGEKPKLLSSEEGIYAPMESQHKSFYRNNDYEMKDALKLRRSSSEGQLIGLIQKHSLMMYTNSLERKKQMKRPLPPPPSLPPRLVTPIFQNNQRRYEKLTDEIKEPNIIFKKRPNCPFPNLANNEAIKIYENWPKKAPTLPSPPKSFPDIDLDPFLISLLNEDTNVTEETYYRDIDQSGAKRLLSGLEDGAFLLRPSKKHFLTLTVKYEKDFFHFGVEKSANGAIRLKTDTVNPDFATVQEMISHFSKQPLIFRHKNGVVTLLLKVYRNMF